MSVVDAWIADEHDDPLCTCCHCERERARDDAEALAREARTRGGLSPLAHELLGPGWLEGETVEPIDIAQLAQRAVGDVFEQLERIGATGRERCRPASAFYASSPVPPAQRLKRHEALELLRYAENALDYARVHLDYLPREREVDDRHKYQVGDRVIVDDEGHAWSGTVRGVSDAGAGTLLVAADDGTECIVTQRDLRECAQ